MEKWGILAKRHNNIIQNFSYLTALQLFNLLSPIIIYPFLIDLFGLALWGKIVLAQSLALYMALFIDFGFDRYATKEVAVHRDDMEKLSKIVSSTVVLRIFLGVIVFVLYTLVVYTIPFFKGDALLYLLFFGINFDVMLFPKWFFQGVEQIKYSVIINVSVKIGFVLLMFLCIESAADFLYVPLFFGLGAFIGGVIGIVIMFRFPDVTFSFYPVLYYYSQLQKSFLLFVSSLVLSVKDRFNVFIVGYFLGMQEVALYDITIKLIGLITRPVEAINEAIYPKIAQELNMNFVKKVALYTLLLVFVLVLGVQFFLHDIFGFLHIEELAHESAIRLVLFSTLFITLSFFLARNCFVVHHKFRLLLQSMIGSSIFYLVLVTALFLVEEISFTFLMIVVFLVYLFEFLYKYFLAYKHNLLVMNIRKCLKKCYHNPGVFGFLLKPLGILYDVWRYRILSKETFTKNHFKRELGYKLDLKNPKTLNEKIQWLKLYDRTPLRTLCADKIAVREYVKEKIGEKHLVPLLIVTQNVNDLTYDHLPQSPFIIKTNHDSGSYKIVKDKDKVEDWEAIRVFFAKRLRANYYYKTKEWPYKNIPPKLLVETLLQTKEGKIPEDYKIHCFGGKPEYIQVDFDRGTEQHSRNWYDKCWNKAAFYCATMLESGKATLSNSIEIPSPPSLDKMLTFAAILSKPFAYVRIDFYAIEDKVYFGEMTFHHNSGFSRIVPFQWDEKLGDMVKLPT